LQRLSRVTFFRGLVVRQAKFPLGFDGNADEHIGMLERAFDRLGQLPLDVGEASDVFPLDIGHFDEDFADGGRFDLAEGSQEVAHVDFELFERVIGGVVYISDVWPRRFSRAI
jgi:hypothetical protein